MTSCFMQGWAWDNLIDYIGLDDLIQPFFTSYYFHHVFNDLLCALLGPTTASSSSCALPAMASCA